MASKSAILAVKIIGDAEKAIGALGKTGLAAGAMGAAVVAAGAVVGKGLYDIGATFDDVHDTIAVGSGLTGDALDDLVDSAKTVGTSVPVEFGDAAEAIAALNTTLGATGKPLEDMTASVLDASRMLGEDGVGNAERFGTAMAQWKRPAEDGADVLDTLFLSTQKYGLGLDDQIGHLNTYGSVLQNAGFSMEEAASLFGQLESGGISISRVMPGLNSAFRGWASEGKNVQDELAGVVDQVKNAETSTEGLAIATDAFGAEGAQRLTTAIRSGKFELDDLAGALDGASGVVEETSAATASASEQWTLLTNNAVAALEPLGSLVFGLVGDAFGALADWIQTVDFTPIEQFAQTVSDALPDLITGFGDLVTGASPLQGILEQLWPSVESIGQAFMDAIPVMMEFGEGMLPLIGSAIEAVIPLLMDIAETAIPAVMGIVEQVLPIVQNILESVVPAVIGAVEELVPKILEIVDPIMDIVSTLLDWLAPAVEFILPLVVGIFDALVTQISGAIDIIVAVLETVSNLLKGDWSAAWESAKGIVDGAITMIEGMIEQGMAIIAAVTGDTIEGVKSTFTDGWSAIVDTVSTKAGEMIEFVKGIPGKITDALGNLGDLLLGSGKALMDGFTQGIKNGVQGALDAASGAVQSVRDFFPFSPAKRGPFSGSGYTDRSGKALVGDFADAMLSEISAVTRAADKVATAGTFEGGFALDGLAAGRAAGRSTAPRRPVHLTVNFNGVTTDRMGAARELKQLLNDFDRLVGQQA